jgi:hypothetical protein
VTASDDDRIAYLTGEGVDSLDARERAELDELRALLAQPATWVEPDAGLEDRIVAAVAAEAAAPRAADSGLAPHRALPRRPGGQRGARWLQRLRPAYALGALAAAAAAVAIVVAIGSGGGSAPTLHFAMVVSGTPLAPQAQGSATLEKTPSGWRVQLKVGGLPHLQNGRYYQAWLRNAAGILVPIGTFNDGRNVTLWSGVPVTQFRTLTVTRQLANGDPASSGQRVLTGTIR